MGYGISTAVGCFLINWPSIALLWRNLLKNIDMSAHAAIFGFVRSSIHQLIQFLAVCETSGHRSIQANRGQAQYGTYFIILREAFSSYGLIMPASMASRMRRDATALLFGLMPNLSRSDALVRKSRITYLRHACR